MARSKKEAGFWAALVAEARASTESLAVVAAEHSVTEAALRYHFYKREKPTQVTNKSVPMLPVRVDGDSRFGRRGSLLSPRFLLA
jgi:hypothetical protein